MIKKLYERSAAWGTRQLNRFNADPFRSARLETALLYFVVGVAIVLVTDFFVDNAIRNTIYSIAVGQTGNPVREAFMHVRQLLWVSRGIKLVLYAVAVYFIAGFAMRHVKRAAELQRRFIATVSHELRTPLTVMKNAKEVALRRKDTLTREQAIGLVEENLVEVNRLSDMVQFLIDFSQLGRQKKLLLAPVELASIASEALALFKEQAAAAGVSLSFEAAAPVSIRGNTTALRQIVTNLVKNAIAHTPRGGSVVVRIDSSADRVRLLVKDNGSGISAKDVPYLFDPFYRGETIPGGSVSAGMGLGLTVVRDLSRLHGANVAVSSIEGVGSEFAVTFKVGV